MASSSTNAATSNNNNNNNNRTLTEASATLFRDILIGNNGGDHILVNRRTTGAGTKKKIVAKTLANRRSIHDPVLAHHPPPPQSCGCGPSRPLAQPRRPSSHERRHIHRRPPPARSSSNGPPPYYVGDCGGIKHEYAVLEANKDLNQDCSCYHDHRVEMWSTPWKSAWKEAPEASPNVVSGVPGLGVSIRPKSAVWVPNDSLVQVKFNLPRVGSLRIHPKQHQHQQQRTGHQQPQSLHSVPSHHSLSSSSNSDDYCCCCCCCCCYYEDSVNPPSSNSSSSIHSKQPNPSKHHQHLKISSDSKIIKEKKTIKGLNPAWQRDPIPTPSNINNNNNNDDKINSSMNTNYNNNNDDDHNSSPPFPPKLPPKNNINAQNKLDHYKMPHDRDGDYSYAYDISVSPAFLIKWNNYDYKAGSGGEGGDGDPNSKKENVYEEIGDVQERIKELSAGNSSTTSDSGIGQLLTGKHRFSQGTLDISSSKLRSQNNRAFDRTLRSGGESMSTLSNSTTTIPSGNGGGDGETFKSSSDELFDEEVNLIQSRHQRVLNQLRLDVEEFIAPSRSPTPTSGTPLDKNAGDSGFSSGAYDCSPSVDSSSSNHRGSKMKKSESIDVLSVNDNKTIRFKTSILNGVRKVKQRHSLFWS